MFHTNIKNICMEHLPAISFHMYREFYSLIRFVFVALNDWYA